MGDSPDNTAGEGDIVRGSVAVDEKGVGEGVGDSPVAPGVIEEGEANSPGVAACEGDIVGEGVGGRVDWVPNRTAAKSSLPRCEPFHPPAAIPAIRSRPVLSTTTPSKIS